MCKVDINLVSFCSPVLSVLRFFTIVIILAISLAVNEGAGWAKYAKGKVLIYHIPVRYARIMRIMRESYGRLRRRLNVCELLYHLNVIYKP